MATKRGNGMQTLLWICLATLMAACASMGRPEGGAKDEIPPEYVSSNPAPGAKNVNKTRITVTFNENIQLEDAFTKVIVSPPQKTPPRITSNGRHVTADIQDTLIPSTTYTIDFADAIKDLNEGNVLDGFALDFSTGDSIDSLRISGMVLQAENLEPAQGMLVGVYRDYTDTSLTTLPFDRIARTNQLGQFTIRNLKPGNYHIFAVNDINRDYHWDRSEDIAFYDTTITPWVESIEVSDTLFASNREDSIVKRPGLKFLPNDILLTWFNLGYKPLYMLDHKRDERRRISLTFSAPMDSLPKITIVDGAPGAGRPAEEWARLKANATLDTLDYWIADTTVLAADSLRLSVQYLKTDTADNIVWSTDTIRFFFKEPKQNKKEKAKKKKNKENEKVSFSVDSVSGDTTFLPEINLEFLNISLTGGSTQELNQPLRFGTDVPIESFDSAGVKLEIMVDTVWRPVNIKIQTDSSNVLMNKKIEHKWTGGGKYRLTIDSLAFRSIYGTWNRPFSGEITAKQPEDYSSIRFTLPGLDTLQTIVQLLNSSDEPVYQAVKPAGAPDVNITFVNPGTYYARLIIDSNSNGKWDTGNPADSILLQPEEVYYFAKKLELKKNWDIDQMWNITELAIDKQKPNAIKKNKPKLKRGETAPEEEDGFGDDQDTEYNPFDRTGRNNNRNNNRGNYNNMNGANSMRRSY